ncbi:alkene reductase [Myroides odoratimimus]|uniref:alkene reductase n=1 Tax=Myroides odoratimimus TaxID=76832 RepID=UPI000468F4DA|nr:alkene reductase [Myroides odoratimimus]
MKLLEPIKLGNKTLKNRLAMAPMTRSRANSNGIVGSETVKYYTQRANAGLIITEAINISEDAIGSPFTPGIYAQEQINAWEEVTTSVHYNGGEIFAQLWHTGRAGHSLDRNGIAPVAPSPVAIQGQQHFTSKGMQDYEVPRELTLSDIEKVIRDFRQAAINAIQAGFDGVEIHAANGYLLHQFLSDNTNHRTDYYGGSITNRNRLILEITRELIGAIGGDKVGIRLSPTNQYNDILTSEPIAQFSQLIDKLDKMNLAYIHLVGNAQGIELPAHYPQDIVGTFGTLTDHTLIANGGYDKETGEAELQRGIANIIAYGTLFLANPDLPKRFELNSGFNELDLSSMYGGTEKGYTDYPFLD